MILLEVSLATALELLRIPPQLLNPQKPCDWSGIYSVIQEDHAVNQYLYCILSLDSATVMALFGTQVAQFLEESCPPCYNVTPVHRWIRPKALNN